MLDRIIKLASLIRPFLCNSFILTRFHVEARSAGRLTLKQRDRQRRERISIVIQSRDGRKIKWMKSENYSE